MSTYTIGEAARRSGFSASALRFYEDIGLVDPASRTTGGYRIYDDRSLARLAFVSRAKQLGCSLEEITDLVSVWDADRCGPVQRRFHELITNKLHLAQQQVIELDAFAAQLQAAAEQLSGEPTDGPCGEDCACLAAPCAPTEAAPVELIDKSAEIPIACTLEPGGMTDRLAEWQAVLDFARSREPIDGGHRVQFTNAIDVSELARLIAAEQHCCRFFSFALTIDHRGTALEVRAPDGAAPMVGDLLGLSL